VKSLSEDHWLSLFAIVASFLAHPASFLIHPANFLDFSLARIPRCSNLQAAIGVDFQGKMREFQYAATAIFALKSKWNFVSLSRSSLLSGGPVRRQDFDRIYLIELQDAQVAQPNSMI
jgi:hypothetical protein